MRLKKLKKHQNFVHLHLHTDHSLLDSVIQIDKLVQFLVANGHWACAITDHGSLSGIYRFVDTMVKHRIKPIVGCEFYYTDDRLKKSDEKLKHITVLSKGVQGWQKLLLAHRRSQDSPYAKPRIDFDILAQLAPDCIVLSGCLSGPANKRLIDGGVNSESIQWFKDVKDIFKDDFYLEIQPNEIDEQKQLNLLLAEVGKKLEIKLVATNDCHYLLQEDWKVHDTLLTIRQSHRGKTVLISDPDRWRYNSRQFNCKSRFEMEKAFKIIHPDLPSTIWKAALDNTIDVVRKISSKSLIKHEKVLPNVDLTGFNNASEKLFVLAWEGFDTKKIMEKTAGKRGIVNWLEHEEIKLPLEMVYRRRIDWELRQICELGFAQYFLVIWDLMRWARSHGIRVGPGRGSVSGSLIAFLLDITAVDSIEYNCPFARFISPDRVDLPDIDIDFPSTSRPLVKQYLTGAYGFDNVGLVSNYNRIFAKGALRDVARVWGVSIDEVNKVAQSLSGAPLEDEFERSSELRQFAVKYSEVYQIAVSLEGQIRSIGQHASGLVISNVPLVDFCPVCKVDDDLVCEWDKRDLESIGLIKLDLLGLDLLDYVSQAIIDIRENRGIEIDLDNLDFDDPLVYEAFRQGHTTLTWQFNSLIATQVLKRLKPNKLSHLVIASALIRPGPLRSGITEKYFERRDGSLTNSLAPQMDEILLDTHGLAIFQEDVMVLVRELAGFSWVEADGLRKVIGKKLTSDQEKYRLKFKEGAIKRGLEEEIIDQIWAQLKEFAAYAFNRAHATAYAMLAFWTQWLKIHFPLEFFCAVLNVQKNLSKRIDYIREVRRLGVEVYPPDVQASDIKTRADVNENVIILGFESIKGFRTIDAQFIVSGQPYQSKADFLNRSGSSKKTVDILTKIGAFNQLEGVLESDFEQQDLFGTAIVDKDVNDEDLKKSKFLLDLVGFPPQLDSYKEIIDIFCHKYKFNLASIEEVLKYELGWYGLICCCITDIGKTKTGKTKLRIEDESTDATLIIDKTKIISKTPLAIGDCVLTLASFFTFDLMIGARLWSIDEDGIFEKMDSKMNKIKDNLSDLKSTQSVKTISIVCVDEVQLKSNRIMGVIIIGGKGGMFRELIVWEDHLRQYSNFWVEGLVIQCPILVRETEPGKKRWTFQARYASSLKIFQMAS